MDDAQERAIHLSRAVDHLVNELGGVRNALEKGWLTVESTFIQTTAIEALATELKRAPDAETIEDVKCQTARTLDSIQDALAAIDTIVEKVRENGMWVALPEFSTEPESDRFPVEASPEVMADLLEKYEVLNHTQFTTYAMSCGILPPSPGATWSIILMGYDEESDMALYWQSGHDGFKGRIG